MYGMCGNERTRKDSRNPPMVVLLMALNWLPCFKNILSKNTCGEKEMTAQTAKNRLLVEKILAFAKNLQRPCPTRSSILAALDRGDIERARQLCDIAEEWL